MNLRMMVAILWVASLAAVVANGGGYSKGGVESSGNIQGFEPKQTEKVQILDEQLTIVLGPESADVEVRYLMKNVSKSKAKVRFGFPVEVERDDYWIAEEQKKLMPDDKLVAMYCAHYEVTAFGKPLKAKFERETRQREDKRFDGVGGWLISEFKLDPGVEMPIRIAFTTHYPYEFSSVSEDSYSRFDTFKYRLSTAACWAGPIAKGRIVIKSHGIRANEVRILKPVNRFRKVEEDWVWNFEDLEPSLADDIEIGAVLAENTYGRYHEEDDGEIEGGGYIERGERWFIEHTAYAIKASSTLMADDTHSYEAAKLKEWEGLWSEGAKGNGVGEWLELKPKVAKPLDAITIKPGCWITDELFAKNARPKKIKVELNGERVFEVAIPDKKEAFRMHVDSYDKPVSKIRLTFLEVWPGTQYEDLCVSQIRLIACLEKKPKIQPAR